MPQRDPAVPAHTQVTTHTYLVSYPAHPARSGDPHYRDFEHFRRLHAKTAQCKFVGTAGEPQCSPGPLELHHAFIEFALTNGVDLAALERDFPGISDAEAVGAWVESEPNFEFLCIYHHRGHGGAHVAAHADYIGERYVRGLIT